MHGQQHDALFDGNNVVLNPGGEHEQMTRAKIVLLFFGRDAQAAPEHLNDHGPVRTVRREVREMAEEEERDCGRAVLVERFLTPPGLACPDFTRKSVGGCFKIERMLLRFESGRRGFAEPRVFWIIHQSVSA